MGKRINNAVKASAVLVCGLLLGGCSVGPQGWEATREAEAADDQIMLVRQEPPSFGYGRLMHQAGDFPDLGVFLKATGLPDFVAETSNGDRHYLILYYVDRRQAYAARNRIRRGAGMEFAGPYPITDREVQLLRGFRSEAAKRRAALASGAG